MQPRSTRPSSQLLRPRSYVTSQPPSSHPPIDASAPVKSAIPITYSTRRRYVSPRLASLALVILGITLIGVLGYLRSVSQPDLPSTVAKQLSFGVYFPATKTSLASIKQGTVQYQSNGGLFSYIATLKDGTTVSVNQQATPESFVDIPQAYDKLVSSLQPYNSFDSINGRVSLTHPKELKGSQSAIMNAKGTLLFAQPSKPLSNEQWRQLFNGLFAQQIPATK